MEKYFSFRGASARSEYWAINLIVIFGGWMALIAMLIASAAVAMIYDLLGGTMVLVSFFIWLVASIWLLLAVGVRRCRDADISPFWVIPLVLPVTWLIMTIVLGVLPSVDPKFIKNEQVK